jgi:hypothetical protein
MTDFIDRTLQDAKAETDEQVKTALLQALNDTQRAGFAEMEPGGGWTGQDAAYWRTRAVAFEGLYREHVQD